MLLRKLKGRSPGGLCRHSQHRLAGRSKFRKPEAGRIFRSVLTVKPDLVEAAKASSPLRSAVFKPECSCEEYRDFNLPTLIGSLCSFESAIAEILRHISSVQINSYRKWLVWRLSAGSCRHTEDPLPL